MPVTRAAKKINPCITESGDHSAKIESSIDEKEWTIIEISIKIEQITIRICK